ncbi:MAG: L-aspartate oxidase [Candidatus Margulisbacteria bacterium]|nr:L-aspartate oxidase [Candidatus Margulisiibacteriota bacterium]MBU1617070.1 L-aspartate oxidase [Candidatus Margulisiibacteriota bacterium]MBU1866990.1 L-aspartate oxidase [Candidatus Margulisiibacteriota bacterium]
MSDTSFSCDFLIIGGGIAGLSAALEASKYGEVILLTKGKTGESATEIAQGGIAAAIDQPRDSTEYHFEDTIAAGANLCDEQAVRVLVTEGVDRVKELIEMGARFDRAETEAGGGFALALEGAHKRRRILHAGDETGKEIEKTLGRRVVSENKVSIVQGMMGIDLLVENGRCYGALALDGKTGEVNTYQAKSTLIATGGVCQTYLYTTNPSFATGDGIAMAYRAGAEVTDLEFVQFHPTALVKFKQFEDIVALPRFLISEAVRGEGGVLLNTNGERFMEKYHVKLELAPRDIVSRAIVQEIKATGSDHVCLSLKGIEPDKIKHRFPMIYQTCLDRGLDITKDNIPVAPAAHYFMGGVKTDTNGKTNLPGLYAAGECASTGVHGANRLASNSLLEGLVFGRRAALAAKNEILNAKYETKTDLQILNLKPRFKDFEIQRYKLIIKTAMWNGAGIIRSKESLENTQHKLAMVEKDLIYPAGSIEELELKNMLLTAQLINRAALDRTESRGAHYRSDFPNSDEKSWKKHLVYIINR